MDAVRSGEAGMGLVPIENSLEGSVTRTLDLLASGYDDLFIVREVTHAIRHQLIAAASCAWTRSPRWSASPSPTASAAPSSSEHLAGVEHEATDSTAEAVRRVSRVDRPWVAIGTRLAADLYEAVVVRDDIEDSLDNRTRFVFLSRDPAPQTRTRPTRPASCAASPRTSRAACC